MTIVQFIKKLQGFHGENVFNPWSEFDTSCDIGEKAPVIRSENLQRYFELRPRPKYLFIAEALGYQGGHFSGIAITSERILLGEHPDVNPQSVLGQWNYQRTSDVNSPLLNKTQKAKGFNEPTDTVVWNAIASHGLANFDCVLWNIFPFHPHQAGNLLSNRTPNGEELDIGVEFAKDLLSMFPGMKIIAIGANAAKTLKKYGLDCEEVRHPSMGGANKFREQVNAILK
ncbi:MAG: uracil-DNA glycosylase [Phascolarctobacterium sp.]|nr:uracil-DNA glycosylase [Phascolarctobacterium sp.]